MSRSRGFLRRAAILAACFPALIFCVPHFAAAQLQQATIAGSLIGPDGAVVDEGVVTLLDSLGEPLVSTRAAAGRFRLTNVPPGTYGLRAEAPPLRALVRSVTVRDALPVEIQVRMSAVAEDQVTVRGGAAEAPTPTTGITLAGEAIRRAPVRLRSRALQDAIATAPGWSTEDNGLLHVRGVDDGFLYVVDGVPVYERLDGLFGNAPDPAMIESVNVVTGYIPAEFGFKAGGVIEVRSASRTADAWLGSVNFGVGSEDARDLSAVVGGPVLQSASLTLGAAGQSSSRFLDPVHPENLHNEGGATSGGGQFGWTVSPGSALTLVSGFSRSQFDVPHGEEQDEAGQDQRQRIGNAWHTTSWQHAWLADTVSQVSGYLRHGASDVTPGPNDTPLVTRAERSLRRIGVLASVTHQRGVHLLKIGGEAARLRLDEEFSFAVVDAEEAEEAGLSEAAIGYTMARPFLFDAAAAPTLYSVYLQDSIRVSGRLTVDLGVRADWARMLASASQVSPRAGMSYHWPASETTLRASVGRFFQPPQAENLLLASSEAARSLSPFVDDSTGGGSELRPERQTAFDLSISQSIARRLRLDASYWRRRVREAADPNVLFGTTLVFPNNVASGRASGVDVRLEVPRQQGWSGYLSYGNAHVVQFGPITGGLFLEDEVIDIGPGTRFTPDHDQRHVGAFGVSFDHDGSGTSVSLAGRYESGTPLEVEDDELLELQERPGAELVDFARRRVRPRQVLDASVTHRLVRTARVDVEVRGALLNLTGERWAYNFGNPFSGTHFGPGRTVQAGVRVSMR